MVEFWICLVKISQGFEYASDSKHARAQIMYGKLVNMQGLHRVLNMPEYAWIWFNNVSVCENML